MSISLLALAASFRPNSLNRDLIALAAREAEQAGARVTMLDYGACDAPIYRGDMTADLPSSVRVLSEQLAGHDGLLLASPEYNWSMPGSLKNLIDWLSVDTTAPLKNRTALLMCASPSVRGGIVGLQQLRIPLEALGMWVNPTVIGIGEAHHHLGETGLDRPKDQQYFTTTIHAYVRATEGLKGLRNA